MDYDIVSATIGSLFTVSDIGGFQLAQIYDYFPFLGETLDILKIVMAFLAGIIFLLLVVMVVKLNRLTARKIDLAKIIAPPSPASSGMNARWEEVQKHISSTREAEWKFAVIEADKIVDDALKNAGFPGDTLGERLMNIEKGQLTTLEDLWTAHKIRNRLAHDINYFLRYAEAKKAVLLYEKTLRELEAI